MKRSELCELVLLEADNIRKNCTDGEISRLDIGLLSPLISDKCIYGLMTGSCENRRTMELVKDLPSHFERVYEVDDNDNEDEWTEEILLNSTVKFETNLNETMKIVFSPIEVYITLSGSDNKNLIDYIKGISNTLDIK